MLSPDTSLELLGRFRAFIMRLVCPMMTAAMVALTTGLVGCYDSPRYDAPDMSAITGVSSTGVEVAKIANLKVGMTMDEVARALAPSQPLVLSVPALVYVSTQKEKYYLVFSEDNRLAQVVRFPSTLMTDGIYLLPEGKRGQPYSAPTEPAE